MKYVNSAFLSDILNPLAGGADMDEMVVYENVDSNDEETIKELIETIFLPYFKQKPDRYKYLFKESLRYFLSISFSDFGGIMESNLLPFYTPDEPKFFYLWLWEVFWPSEKFELKNLNEYYEKYDMYEPVRCSIKSE